MPKQRYDWADTPCEEDLQQALYVDMARPWDRRVLKPAIEPQSLATTDYLAALLLPTDRSCRDRAHVPRARRTASRFGFSRRSEAPKTPDRDTVMRLTALSSSSPASVLAVFVGVFASIIGVSTTLTGLLFQAIEEEAVGLPRGGAVEKERTILPRLDVVKQPDTGVRQ